jgi:hypothetical protein
LTFSEKSKIEVLRGDIVSKYQQMENSDWGMNTNLQSAFEEILRVATENKVSEEQMPKYLVIFSDMEFDAGTKTAENKTAFQMAKTLYAEAGYTLPNIVWWNLNARQGNVPVKFDERGTALVSGFSPSLMKSILKAEDFTPVSIMLETVNSERYSCIV